ncbi:AI-2E family transporter [Ferruginibacter sp.]|uniref:AI-2E family transporter n=1 Tax=Ferruginibacter sp. TaxID=1940288 RepID=UPI00265A1214|nr:AI-2E family transporter [Ferruginibacter sp.]
MTEKSFNNRLRQVLMIGLILFLVIVFISQLYIFLPGILGGITLYILSRKLYQKLTIEKKWNKAATAILFILCSLIIITIPVYFSVIMVSPKINSLINNQNSVIQGAKIFSGQIESSTGFKLLSDENTQAISKKISAFIPGLINSTATLLTNLLMMFFLLYYLLVSGQDVEKYLHHIIPLAPENVDKLASETILMIRANALGIPIICIVQGVFATLGYLIFGLKEWGMWGFVTGVFAFFPLLGTMIIWVPLVIFFYSTGHNYAATGLTIYSFIVTGNVDYITRLGLLKKMGNVHPMITVLGVIVGLKLFGFIGLIFGPLLISYFIILIKIYLNEFTSEKVINDLEA